MGRDLGREVRRVILIPPAEVDPDLAPVTEPAISPVPEAVPA